MEYLIKHTYPADITPDQQRKIRNQANFYLVRSGLLFRINRQNPKRPLRVITQKEKQLILYTMHTNPLSGHFGIKATIQRTLEKYYWPSLGKDIREYIEACDACQRRGRPKATEPMRPLIVGQPFSRIGIDIVGPLKRSKKGNIYIITATDYLMKWVEAKALKEATAKQVAQFLWEEIICRYGAPQEILSDRGKAFLNETIQQLCEDNHIKHRLASAYHPQTNGLVERFNKTLCEMLAKNAANNQEEWDNYLLDSLFAYRIKVHSTT